MIPTPKLVACLTSDNNRHALMVVHPLGQKLVIELLQEYKNINATHTIKGVLDSLPVQKILVSQESMFLFKTVRKTLKRSITTVPYGKDIEVISCAQITQLAYKSFTLQFLDKETEDRFVKTTSKRFDPKDIPVLLQSIYLLIPFLFNTPSVNNSQIEPPGVML